MYLIAASSDPIPFIFFGGFILLVGALIIFSIRYQKKRRADLRQVANELGMDFHPEKSSPDAFDFASMKFFNHGRSRQIQNRISGPIAETTGMLFDYQYTVGSGKSSSTYNQTVAAFQIPSARLPQFSCKPEHFFHRIANIFGFNDIDFPQYPLFSKKYHLSGDHESDVRALFTDNTIQYLEAHLEKQWSIDGHDDWLILYQTKKSLSPKEWPSFLLEAIELMNSMTLRS